MCAGGGPCAAGGRRAYARGMVVYAHVPRGMCCRAAAVCARGLISNVPGTGSAGTVCSGGSAGPMRIVHYGRGSRSCTHAHCALWGYVQAHYAICACMHAHAHRALGTGCSRPWAHGHGHGCKQIIHAFGSCTACQNFLILAIKKNTHK